MKDERPESAAANRAIEVIDREENKYIDRVLRKLGFSDRTYSNVLQAFEIAESKSNRESLIRYAVRNFEKSAVPLLKRVVKEEAFALSSEALIGIALNCKSQELDFIVDVFKDPKLGKLRSLCAYQLASLGGPSEVPLIIEQVKRILRRKTRRVVYDWNGTLTDLTKYVEFLETNRSGFEDELDSLYEWIFKKRRHLLGGDTTRGEIKLLCDIVPEFEDMAREFKKPTFFTLGSSVSDKSQIEKDFEKFDEKFATGISFPKIVLDENPQLEVQSLLQTNGRYTKETELAKVDTRQESGKLVLFRTYYFRDYELEMVYEQGYHLGSIFQKEGMKWENKSEFCGGEFLRVGSESRESLSFEDLLSVGKLLSPHLRRS